MVALDLVHASNAQLRELGPGLVALFGAPQASLASLLQRITILTALQLEQLQELENTLPKHSSRMPFPLESTLSAAAKVLRIASSRSARN